MPNKQVSDNYLLNNALAYLQLRIVVMTLIWPHLVVLLMSELNYLPTGRIFPSGLDSNPRTVDSRADSLTTASLLLGRFKLRLFSFFKCGKFEAFVLPKSDLSVGQTSLQRSAINATPACKHKRRFTPSISRNRFKLDKPFFSSSLALGQNGQ